MLDSIHVGMTGLAGYSQGLRVIANNTANLNTAGFKAATLRFTDSFYSPAGSGESGGAELGHGLGTSGTALDMSQGDLRPTGSGTDLGLDGEGLFVLRDPDGRMRYTRAGNFEFDANGRLVDKATSAAVLGTDASGAMVEITKAGLQTSRGIPTTAVRFTGNLSSTVETHTSGSFKVQDAQGAEHQLAVRFTNTASTLAGSWKVELMEGSVAVGDAQLVFADGTPTSETARLAFTYTPDGGVAQALTLDFSADATSFASGSLSTLAMSSQDGKPPANLTGVAFNAAGVLVATYANGQAIDGVRLLLARLRAPGAARLDGHAAFAAADGDVDLGHAGDAGFGHVRAGMLEASNVDLSREFSELVIVQRGYQASSQVISTANDMLQELFNLRK
jgi:flagellar hook protein FlgE